MVLFLIGCANSEKVYFDNVVKIRHGGAELIIPYISPEYTGLSVQSKGEIPYDFYILYQTEDFAVELSQGELEQIKSVKEPVNQTIRY